MTFDCCSERWNDIISLLLFSFWTSQDHRKLVFVVEHMAEAYIVVLKSLAGEKSVCMSLVISCSHLYSLVLS